jgi:hypothetical protein
MLIILSEPCGMQELITAVTFWRKKRPPVLLKQSVDNFGMSAVNNP